MGCCESLYLYTRETLNGTNNHPDNKEHRKELLLREVKTNNIYNKFNIREYRSQWKITQNTITLSKHSIIYLAEKIHDSVLPVNYVAKVTTLNNEIECYNLIANRHKSIINMYDYYTNDFGQILFLEYVPNTDLFNFIMENTISDKIIIDIFKQLVEVVKFLHNIKIAHRDLKLENILYLIENDRIHIKLCDFDLSTINTTISIDPCGTIMYFSPEMVKEDSYNVYAHDMWCLGIILYSMKYKRAPFNIRRIMDIDMNGLSTDTITNIKDKIDNQLTLSLNMRDINDSDPDVILINNILTKLLVPKDRRANINELDLLLKLSPKSIPISTSHVDIDIHDELDSLPPPLPL